MMHDTFKLTGEFKERPTQRSIIYKHKLSQKSLVCSNHIFYANGEYRQAGNYCLELGHFYTKNFMLLHHNSGNFKLTNSVISDLAPKELKISKIYFRRSHFLLIYDSHKSFPSILSVL